MNPSDCAQPAQLYGASIHAGGWPKLGWAAADADGTQEWGDDAPADEDQPRVFS